MAKIKRIIRKLKPVASPEIAEQLWPIYVALLLFGGLLVGVVLAYLRFDDRLWYRNAVLWLLLVPVAIGSAMVALYFINTRYMRRTIQLAMVLSIICHFVFFWQLYYRYMPLDDSEVAKKGMAKKPEQMVRITIEQPVTNERQQRDFERPVEAKEPETQPEEIDRSQPEPEPVKTPEIAQPTPRDVVEPKPTPQATERAVASQTAPRFSDSPSKLSRQVSKAAPTTNRSADAPEVAASTTKTEVKPEVAVAKQASDAPASPRKTETEPTATEPTKETQVARRETQRELEPQSTAAPTLEKKTTKPVVAPPTAIAKVETPSTTKETSTSELTPRTVSPDKRSMESPQVAANTTEPSPETPTEVKPQVERRATQAPQQPTIAQAQESVANPKPRETARPNIATVASATPTADTPQQSSTTDAKTPANTTVAKATSAPSATPSAKPVETPETSTATPTVNVARRSPSATPIESTTAAAVVTPNKTATNPGVATSTAAEKVLVASANSAAEGEVSPTSVATRKQTTESPQSTLASGAPASAIVSGAATTSPAAVASRRPSAENSPTVAKNDTSAGSGKTASKVALNATSTAETNATNIGAAVAADATAVGPSSAQVARQPTNSPGATTSRQPLAAESLSPSTQVASASANKASAASVPTINPSQSPTSSPARSRSAATGVASPENIETPSIAATATGEGDPSAQPARMAITKSLAGVAGVGQSPNLDRSAPAADNPSLVASGSARREQATQDMPEGPALAPSSTAVAGRSRATANAPSAQLKADMLENASNTGAEQVAKVDAAVGAALEKQSSNATQGPVSAAPGQVEVDVGPTQVVADSGASSRAAGGGQPTVNTESQSKQLARREVGGSPAARLATDTKADVPTAPSGTGGGAPKALDVNTQATAIARTDAGGAQAVSGAPSAATERGPATEVNAASLVGEAALARNDNAAAGGAPQTAGQPNVTDEQEKATRVAKSAGGAPQLAVGGPTTAAVANIPKGDGGAPSAAEAQPAQTSVAKSSAGSAGAIATAPSGAIAAPSTGGIVAATNVGRAEAVEAAPGTPAPGGGQAAQPRRSTGPAIAANTAADVPTVSGSPTTGGSEEGTPVASAGATVTNTGGAKSAGAAGAVGSAANTDADVAGPSAPPGEAVAQRAAGAATGDAPSATANSAAGSPGRKSTSVALDGGPSAVAEVIGGGTQVARASGDNPLTGMERGQMTRQEATGAIPVNVAADEGPGGLGGAVAINAGINSRRASADSMDVQVKDARFIRQKSGGDLDINTSAIVATDGFRKRGPDGRGGAGASGPQTEQSIEIGLVFLERKQLQDGSWSLQGHDDFSRSNVSEIRSDTAATALAVLAFQGAGYNHREHKYKEVVSGGLQYLLKNQQKNGDLFVKMDDASNSSAWLYSHALGTLALCEAYGMTGDPALREPAQKAIDFIVDSQNKERGGWRYSPGVGADTSVTGWMMMALKSGELANLDVPADTYAKIRKWTEASTGGAGKQHLYRYDPWAPDRPDRVHGRVPSKTMTSVGLLMQLYLGAKKDSLAMRRGADFLLDNPPTPGTGWNPERDTINNTPRDTYYWYYATQVMWHMGGEYRDRWLAQIHPMLLKTQVQTGANAGSWDPVTPVPDRWGYHAGRLYVTTMNLLSLEVKYRYLPIYTEEPAK